MATTINLGDDAPTIVAAASASETFTFEAGTHKTSDWGNGGVILARSGDTYTFTNTTVVCEKVPFDFEDVTAAQVTITNPDFDIREPPFSEDI